LAKTLEEREHFWRGTQWGLKTFAVGVVEHKKRGARGDTEGGRDEMTPEESDSTEGEPDLGGGQRVAVSRTELSILCNEWNERPNSFRFFGNKRIRTVGTLTIVQRDFCAGRRLERDLIGAS